MQSIDGTTAPGPAQKTQEQLDDEEVAYLAAVLTSDTIQVLLEGHGQTGKLLYDPENVVSQDKILQVADFAFRDLDRVERDHPHGVSVTKYVAYVGFWFGKLKPITMVHALDHQGNKFEIVDVNERVAVVIMDRILWRLAWGRSSFPTPWKECTVSDCQHTYDGKTLKGLCYLRKNALFLASRDNQYSDYISYSLRNRAVSPYFLVNYLDEGLFYSCESSCKPLFGGK